MKIKRLLSKKVLLAGILIYLFQALVFMGSQMGESGFQVIWAQNQAYNQLVENWSAIPLEESLAESEILLKEDKNIVTLALNEKIHYLAEFTQSIEKILQNAENAKKFSIFRTQNEFTYQNILKTAEDFSQLEGVKLTLDKDRATQHVLEYSFLTFFVIAFLAYVLYESLRERDNGMLAITHTMGNGRYRMAFNRGIGLAIIAAGFYAVSFGTNLLLSSILYGADDLGGAIQTIQTYALYPVSITKGAYLGLFLLKGTFSTIVLVVLVYFVFTALNSKNLAVVTLLSVFAVEWKLMDWIPVYSNLKVLRYVNLMRIFDCSTLDKEYKNLNLFGHAVPASTILLVVEIVGMAVLFALTIYIYGKKYPRQGYTLFEKLFEPIGKMIRRLTECLPFYLKEVYKILVIKRGLVFILFSGFVCIWISQKTQVVFPDLRKDMDQAYLTHGGNDWNSFDIYVKELKEQMDDYNAKANEMAAMIREDSLKSDKVSEISELQARAAALRIYLKEFNEKQTLRRNVSENQKIDIYAMSDRGYNEIIGKNSTLREIVIGILLIVLSIVLTSQVFGMERQAHTIPLLKSAKKGITWVWGKKVVCIFSIVGILFLVFYGGNLYGLLQQYETPYLNAPIQSLTFLSENKANVSIMQFLILNIAFKGLITFCAVAATLFISSHSRVVNQMYVPILIVVFAIGYVVVLTTNAVWLLMAVITGMIFSTLFGIIGSYRNWCK